MKKDINLYNEATGWTLHSESFGGKPRDEVQENLQKAVENHLILPMQLVQDDPLNIRVTTGKLSAAEEAEWVSKVVARLSIPCGTLVLEGGFDPRASADFIRSLKVPPGDYKIEVYTFFWGINGEYCLQAAKLYEPVGTWFRRTRPDKRFPALLKSYLGENAEEDPGFEEKWDEFYESEKYEELEVPDLVDFLVRLTPWRDGNELDLPEFKDGWLPVEHKVRKPELCPVGVKFLG